MKEPKKDKMKLPECASCGWRGRNMFSREHWDYHEKHKRPRKVKLPSEIKPWMLSTSADAPICDVKVKCPVCNELMLPQTLHPTKGPMKTPCNFRTCLTCGSNFTFSIEARKIVWQKTHQ